MTFDKIKKIIVEVLKVDEAKVTLEASLADDLEADSIDAVDVIVAIEDAFDISITDEAAQGLKTVKDVVDYVDSQL